MSDSAASSFTYQGWTIVFDDDCPMVRKFARVIRRWDRNGFFRLVGRDTNDLETLALRQQLEDCPWSLLLIDNDGQTWSGPEAIPFILKNLPGGKLAAVTYTLPGMMWTTRQLYMILSRNRRMFQHSRQMQLQAPPR